MSGGTATTGNASSHVAAANGAIGQVIQVTATPTLPLCQMLPKYINAYGLISDIQGKTIVTPTARIHKVSGREFISFMAANEAKDSVDFIRVCKMLNEEEPSSEVAVGDLVLYNGG